MSVLAVFIGGSLLIFLANSTWEGPVVDFWRFLPVIERHLEGEEILGSLFAPHAGHRPFFPRLLYLLEYAVFDGRNRFLLCCGLLLQSLNLLILLNGARRSLAASEAWFARGIGVALLFSATQIQNFARGWNVLWFLALTGMLGAVLALVRLREALESGASNRIRGSLLLISLGSGVLSSFSMANGLLVWPLLLVLGLGMRMPVRFLVPVVGVGAVVIATDVSLGRGITGADSLAAAGRALHWMSLCLGAPLSWTHPIMGQILGVAGAISATTLAILRLLSPRPWARLEASSLALVLYALGSCAMAALARSAISFELWAAPRYQGFVLLLWLGLTLLAMQAVARRTVHGSAVRWIPSIAAIAWVIAILLPAHILEGRAMEAWAAGARSANLAIAAGVRHRPTYRHFLPAYLAPNEDPAARFAPLLRDRDLGMFAGPADEFLGQVVGETLPITQEANACRGEIVSVQVLGGAEAAALRLSGWAWEASRNSPPAWLLVADTRRIVVGIGAPVWRSVLPTGRGGDGAAMRWIAYSVSPTGDRVVEVWAVLSDQSLCRVGNSLRPVTPDRAAPRAAATGQRS